MSQLKLNARSSPDAKTTMRHISPKFRSLSRLGFMCYACRVPAIVAVAILLAGWQVDQIHEVVRVHLLDLDHAVEGSPVVLNLVAIYAGLFLLSWTQLFWSEYALANRFPLALANNKFLRLSYRCMPALLAYLPWLGGMLALMKADLGLGESAHVLAVVLRWAVFFVGFFCIAAYYSRRARAAIQRRHNQSADIEATVFGHSDWLMVSLGLGLGLFLLATLNPWKMGAWFGTVGILLAACVAVVPALTWFTASVRLPRWHWLTMLLAVALMWSTFDLNDNHELRQLVGQSTRPKAPAYGHSFQKWLLARSPKAPAEPFPVVFVAAEGGGIRAAYFTAQVLAAIHDQCPEFARHLFVVSGVSGGSVGAAVFAGMLDALPQQAPDRRLGCAQETPEATPMADRVEQVLKTDYLAPLSATLLFPDAFQRFLPFPVPAWDRARTLELSIETSFEAAVGTDFMKKSLYAYWSSEKNLPVLFLNTTSVETGSRIVAAPLYPLEERFHRLASFYELFPSADFRISTVAVTSARFPLVTPAGAVVYGGTKRRLVDGGYFENSGAVTLSEAIDVALLAAKEIGREMRPVVIRIGNSPSMLAATEKRKARSDVDAPSAMWLGELLSPVRAMVNTRSARGVLAADMLETTVTTLQDNHQLSDHIQFQIGVDDVEIPLGWQLSSAVRDALRAQLKAPPNCDSTLGVVNGCAVAKVVDVLRQWSDRYP